MGRRRLAVSAVVVIALVGEWLGHAISYLRVAGLPGLQAGLGGGLHDYMIPFAAALLGAALAGATAFTRAWLSMGRRLDAAGRLLYRLRSGRRVAGVPEARAKCRAPSAPSATGQWLALGLTLSLLQCLAFAVQENVERLLHGLPGVGLAPLLDAGGAGTWIQAALAFLLAVALLFGARLLRSRADAVGRIEGLVRALWLRIRRAASPPSPVLPHVPSAHLLFIGSLRRRPPPLHSAP